MRKTTLNGKVIPYDKTVEELAKMAKSSSMQDFSLACEALSFKPCNEAYEIMKSYVDDKDKYRRLYILKTIFRHLQATELKWFLEDSISSDDWLFAENGLQVVSDLKIKVSEEILIGGIYKHLPKLYTAVSALCTLDVNDDNFHVLQDIYARAKLCVQKECICDILFEKYLPSKSRELFEMCCGSEFGKIRVWAVKLGRQYGYDISSFASDKDGHVHKAVNKPL